MMAVMMVIVRTEFAHFATPNPAPFPQGGGEQRRRACIHGACTAHCALPPPLRGRVGEVETNEARAQGDTESLRLRTGREAPTSWT
jgi:hypothetical protein